MNLLMHFINGMISLVGEVVSALQVPHWLRFAFDGTVMI